MAVKRLFDLRMHDGSRHFGDLPERYDPAVPQWELIRAAIATLDGAVLRGFLSDQVTEAWIDFEWRGQRFSINDQCGEWWFFVDDPSCPDVLLGAVLDHFEAVLDPVRVAVPDGYAVGRAHTDELAQLRAIEDAAAVVFPPGLLSGESADGGVAPELLAQAAIDGRLWVVRTTTTSTIVGFAVMIEVDGNAHLHEMDVLPEHARRGLGRALIEQVAAWARRQRYPALTLLTFRDVAWNAPFYRGAGFVDLDDAALGPELAAMRGAEADKGLDVGARVAMLRAL